jgi:hypothetical protein
MNESQVFANALRRATPAERAAYRDEACAGSQSAATLTAALRSCCNGLRRLSPRSPRKLNGQTVWLCQRGPSDQR